MPPRNAGNVCGAYNTGTVDSRDAVGERTGMYSPRVPVMYAPQPLTPLHATGGWISGVIRKYIEAVPFVS
jgi:hypothetical protein